MPKECCGLLLAIGRKQQYFPCINVSTEPNKEFRIDPEEYAAAEDVGEVIGVVHSHPDATSRPSPRDLAMCEATALPWHILSWPEGDLPTIVPTGDVPLLKRPFVHGAWDCWQVCADWYKREWGLEFETFTGGATHYYALSMKRPPAWAAKAKQTLKLGGHVFFKDVL